MDQTLEIVALVNPRINEPRFHQAAWFLSFEQMY
jgi:hypothetical protein